MHCSSVLVLTIVQTVLHAMCHAGGIRHRSSVMGTAHLHLDAPIAERVRRVTASAALGPANPCSRPLITRPQPLVVNYRPVNPTSPPAMDPRHHLKDPSCDPLGDANKV